MTSDLPREAKHDFSYGRVKAWRNREESEEQYDLTVLGITAGMEIEVELRDGSRHRGKVRQRSDGQGWWMPQEHDGKIVLDPGGVELSTADIIAVSAEPDPTFEHQSERPPDD